MCRWLQCKEVACKKCQASGREGEGGESGGLDRGNAVLQFRAKEENYVLHTYVRRADLACRT